MARNKELQFPHAPEGWSPEDAARIAKEEGLELKEDHWEVVHALQEYFARHEDKPFINMRDLHDALDEKFHIKGGLRYLYLLLPKGPIAQGCRLAGLKPPFLAEDKNFGSVA
jgi:tRNA 2-thiouridine synthesizing protein E